MALRSFNDPHGTSDAARQFLADRACERNHPKRHATGARTKRLSKRKRARIKLKLAKQWKERTAHIAQVKAYWAGERENHP